jgi:hypothetical protein
LQRISKAKEEEEMKTREGELQSSPITIMVHGCCRRRGGRETLLPFINILMIIDKLNNTQQYEGLAIDT